MVNKIDTMLLANQSSESFDDLDMIGGQALNAKQ
jgi:hypothetical protein